MRETRAQMLPVLRKMLRLPHAHVADNLDALLSTGTGEVRTRAFFSPWGALARAVRRAIRAMTSALVLCPRGRRSSSYARPSLLPHT